MRKIRFQFNAWEFSIDRRKFYHLKVVGMFIMIDFSIKLTNNAGEL